METGLVNELRCHHTEPAHGFDADRNAGQRRGAVRTVALAGGQHCGHDDGARMHRTALERVVEVLPMGSRTVDQRGAGRAQHARMPDRRARAVIVAGCEGALHVIQTARREAEPYHVNRESFAFCHHRCRQARRIDGDDAFGKTLSDGREGFDHMFSSPRQLYRRRTPPKPGMRLIRTTTANVSTSMMMPSTAMAPRSPLSLRSKINTEITLVSDVNSMMAADSSRITPMNMKHQVAITLVRNRGAVMRPRVPRRVAPRIRLASSRSGLTTRKAAGSAMVTKAMSRIHKLLYSTKGGRV